MAGWTVQDVLQEMAAVADLITHRRNTAASGEDMDTIEQHMIQGLLNKVGTLSLDARSTLQLIQEVDGRVGYSSTSKSKLKTAIETRLGAVNAGLNTRTALWKPQNINISFYLTDSDWNQLKNSTNYHFKITLIAKKLRALGLQTMSEQTTKYATATLLCCYQQLPDAVTIHHIVNDIKLGFASTKAYDGMPFLLTYPQDPRDLPRVILDNAYPDGGPANRCPEQFAMVLKQVPMRKTNKLLSQAPSSEPSSGSGSNTSPLANLKTGNAGMDMAFKMFGTMFETMMGNLQGFSSDKRPTEPKIEISPSKVPVGKTSAAKVVPALRVNDPTDTKTLPVANGAPSKQLALEDTTAHSATLPTQASAPTAQEIEEATFNQLKAKQAQAKAKAKASSKSKAMKKAPKEKAKAKVKSSLMKKPSSSCHSAATPFTYVVSPPGPEWKGRTYDSWTSKHYHAARQLAGKCGLSDDDAKQKGRDARQQASDIWMKCM